MIKQADTHTTDTSPKASMSSPAVEFYPVHDQYLGVEKTPEEVIALMRGSLGDVATDFVQAVAKMGFDEFSSNIRAMTAAARGSGRSRHYLDIPSRSRLANAAISLRYPFLMNVSWLAEGKDDWLRVSNPFESSALEDMPRGWDQRFGLDIAEDIRTILSSAKDPKAAFADYEVAQIKEKFGTLRWYDSSPEGMGHHLLDLASVYEAISEQCCATCGSFDEVLITTRGYIIPECMSCHHEDMIPYVAGRREDPALAFAIDHGYEERYLTYALRCDIEKYLALQERTQVSVSVRERCDSVLYSGGEEKRYNSMDRLREAFPDLRVFEVARQADEARKVTVTEEEIARRIREQKESGRG